MSKPVYQYHSISHLHHVKLLPNYDYIQIYHLRVLELFKQASAC